MTTNKPSLVYDNVVAKEVADFVTEDEVETSETTLASVDDVVADENAQG